ncbi:unknown [Clostridium sp. CAG:1000]|nr:unknown [Clostridium sp. CAG:1000]
MIKYKYDSEVIFDISNLDKSELSLLYDAIDDNKHYIDIEMFFIGDSNIPNFGPDYNYIVNDNKLILKYIF